MSELADSLLTAAQCISRAVVVGKNLRNVLKTHFIASFSARRSNILRVAEWRGAQSCANAHSLDCRVDKKKSVFLKD